MQRTHKSERFIRHLLVRTRILVDTWSWQIWASWIYNFIAFWAELLCEHSQQLLPPSHLFVQSGSFRPGKQAGNDGCQILCIQWKPYGWQIDLLVSVQTELKWAELLGSILSCASWTRLDCCCALTLSRSFVRSFVTLVVTFRIMVDVLIFFLAFHAVEVFSGKSPQWGAIVNESCFLQSSRFQWSSQVC